MKKNLIQRGIMGFFPGIAIGFLITVIISACIGDGNYHPVTPSLSVTMGSELNAVILQTALCGIMGAGSAMASVIWEMDSWSIAKQNGIYFGVICALSLPFAYLANWMEHSLQGVLSYIGVFVLVYFVLWIAQYLMWRSRIKKMNQKMQNSHRAE